MRIIKSLLPLLFVIACSKLPESQTGESGESQAPDQVIWNGRIEVIEGGKLKSVIQAGKISTYEKRKITELDSGVVVDFYNSRGTHSSQLTSRRARIEEVTDLFLAQDSVVVVSDSGATLRSERLYWDRQARKIRSDTLVIMTTEYDSLRGYDFEADEDLTSWSLKQPTGQTFRRMGKK
jgi:LPS export ABC transporter protein LptC